MSENEAKKFFEKAIENYNEKKFDLAEKNFELALNLSPNRISILENLASIYLLNKKLPTSIEELQKEVWGYNSELETHTVETHIHRLRKKIKEKFNEDNLIISSKNGYKIK